MITKENITIYICQFCKKYLQRKHAMENHEIHCGHNPKNYSACSGCVHLKQTEKEYSIGCRYDGEPIDRKSISFQCTKLNKELYPYKVIKKGLLEKYPETFEGAELMPSKCEFQQYKDYFNATTAQDYLDIPF